ncbi:MAG: hypothetical protein IIC27_03280 [Chloroflexi bacterium]|nr:hypothetical protein [Chloroflexota bacterium]
MKNVTRVFLLSGLAILALAAVACSSGGSDADENSGVALPAASLPNNDGATAEPPPITDITDAGVSGPITILDTVDLNKCNFIHAMNACFTEGALPEDISPGEVIDVYYDARDMLAEALGVDPSSAKITNIKRVDWPDSSLGVPEPGFSYATVITPGFKLVMELEPEGKQYVFHTSTDRVVPEQPIQ